MNMELLVKCRSARVCPERLKNCRPLKRILTLPTWGQKCIVSELYPKDISNFDLGHPVIEVEN